MRSRTSRFSVSVMFSSEYTPGGTRMSQRVVLLKMPPNTGTTGEPSGWSETTVLDGEADGGSPRRADLSAALTARTEKYSSLMRTVSVWTNGPTSLRNTRSGRLLDCVMLDVKTRVVSVEPSPSLPRNPPVCRHIR
eukprot:3649478-Rhodomonas_salina.2